ncbi:N-acetylmuramoyl-L-alanine amidase [Almyronema epifaneia]|uniref:N-acetylmuramoyl-L-alanine amidase n=1 Tax=Almyronema epifaneia S1 TaxID=2991925 RepID=A0ABW6IGG1_9CYAN
MGTAAPIWWGTGLAATSLLMMNAPGFAQQSLFVAYPPANHETVADRIFIIGTADPDAEVRINGQVVDNRSPAGHFAPTWPLALGENTLTLTQGDERLTLSITRLPNAPQPPSGVAFVPDSLTPAVDIARLPSELICFGAIAPERAAVSVVLAGQTLPLEAQPSLIELPPNSAVLTDQNNPYAVNSAVQYEGCITGAAIAPMNETATEGEITATASPAFGATERVLGVPEFQLQLNGQTLTQIGSGQISLLQPGHFQVATVTAEAGVARTGPSTDYSRLTPLPQGTRAAITGREGDWLRLDYGGWIRASETEIRESTLPPRSLIRSVRSRLVAGATEVLFPLQVPVPVSVEQSADRLTLTLYNTVPQTDTIFFNDDPIVERLDWRPVLPDQVEYSFQFKTDQQWGYSLRYEGTTLILSLRHPPTRANSRTPLQGATILLDPGHGSAEDLGARGPTGYPEKDVTLTVAKLLRDRLEAQGATVVMTREGDDDLYPGDRVAIIEQIVPTLALSLHYNALPDNGDALNTAGIGTFWYHAQAHDLAVFLHNYLTTTLNRPSYGVFWNNLALTRPSIAPSVLLELGFMINPAEFEWITDPAAQQQLADALATGIEQWIQTQAP